jgi:hypothetical protein
MRGGMIEKTFTHVEEGVAGEIHVSALVGWKRSAGQGRGRWKRGGLVVVYEFRTQFCLEYMYTWMAVALKRSTCLEIFI